jgi:hypothetical protein
MEGETNSVLAIHNFLDDLAGTYVCHVTNPCGTVVTRPVAVSIKPAPASTVPAVGGTGVLPVTIVRVSEDVTLAFGDTLRLEVVTAGSSPLTYQWCVPSTLSPCLPVSSGALVWGLGGEVARSWGVGAGAGVGREPDCEWRGCPCPEIELSAECASILSCAPFRSPT